MIEHLTFLETLVIMSATLQIFVILLSIWLSIVKGWRTWIWMVVAASGIFGRRIVSMLRFTHVTAPSLEVEFAITFLVSISLLVFLLKIILKDYTWSQK
jgi:hypothetical protein